MNYLGQWPMLAQVPARLLVRGGSVEDFNRKLTEWSETPLGAILIPVLLYIARIELRNLIDRIRKRKARKPHPKGGAFA